MPRCPSPDSLLPVGPSPGLVPALCRQLEHSDSTVRQRAALCLSLIAEHAVGRQDLLRHDALTHLSWRFMDKAPLVRRNVHQVIDCDSGRGWYCYLGVVLWYCFAVLWGGMVVL